MSVTLVLGGVRSGKSRYAERLLRDRPQVTYVAPATAPDPDDDEWAARLAEHRRRRPPTWRTVETADLAGALVRASSPVLVDCLGTWLTGLLDEAGAWGDAGRATAHLAAPTRALLDALSACAEDVVLVSNEVGMGVVPPTASGRLFRDALGRLNAAVSAASDTVLLVVAGRVVDLSACPVVAP